MKYQLLKHLLFLVRAASRWKNTLRYLRYFRSLKKQVLLYLCHQKSLKAAVIFYTPLSFQVCFAVAVTNMDNGDKENIPEELESWLFRLACFASIHVGYISTFIQQLQIRKLPGYATFCDYSPCILSCLLFMIPVVLHFIFIIRILQGLFLGLLHHNYSECEQYASSTVYEQLVVNILLSTITVTVLTWKYVFYFYGIIGIILFMLLHPLKQKRNIQSFCENVTQTSQLSNMKIEKMFVRIDDYWHNLMTDKIKEKQLKQKPEMRKCRVPLPLITSVRETTFERKFYNSTLHRNTSCDACTEISNSNEEMSYYSLSHQGESILFKTVIQDSLLNMSNSLYSNHTNNYINNVDNSKIFTFEVEEYHFNDVIENEFWTVSDMEFWNIYKTAVHSIVLSTFVQNDLHC